MRILLFQFLLTSLYTYGQSLHVHPWSTNRTLTLDSTQRADPTWPTATPWYTNTTACVNVTSFVPSNLHPLTKTGSLPSPSLSLRHDSSLAKRTLPLTQWGNGWGTTWVGYFPEPPNSGWTKETIHFYAREAYIQAVGSTQVTLLMAALWIRGDGIFFGSVPHDGGQTEFHISAEVRAPRLWKEVKSRSRVNRNDGGLLWHAEDMAMYVFESMRAPILGYYPDGAFLALYGRLERDGRLGTQAPCSGDSAKIFPSCLMVLNKLDVNLV